MRSDRHSGKDLSGLPPDMLLGEVLRVKDAKALMMLATMMAETVFEGIRGKTFTKADSDELSVTLANKVNQSIAELHLEADGDMARSLFRRAFEEAFAEFKKAGARSLN